MMSNEEEKLLIISSSPRLHEGAADQNKNQKVSFSKSIRAFLILMYLIFLHLLIFYDFDFKFEIRRSLTNINYTSDSRERVTLTGIEGFKNWTDPLKILVAPRQDICKNINYLLVVRSNVEDFEKRQIYRDTYGKFAKLNNFTLMFSLGRTANQTFTVKVLNKEISKHMDILQSNFMDSFRNISYKTASILDFYLKNCDPSVVLVKMDDDVRWRVASTTNMIERFKNLPYGITCNVLPSHPPIYGHKKWNVTKEEYSEPMYPSYCQGAVFILKYSASAKVMKQLPYTRFFWLDDIFFTGIIREKVNETMISYKSIMDLPPFHVGIRAKLQDFFRKDYPDV